MQEYESESQARADRSAADEARILAQARAVRAAAEYQAKVRRRRSSARRAHGGVGAGARCAVRAHALCAPTLMPCTRPGYAGAACTV